MSSNVAIKKTPHPTNYSEAVSLASSIEKLLNNYAVYYVSPSFDGMTVIRPERPENRMFSVSVGSEGNFSINTYRDTISASVGAVWEVDAGSLSVKLTKINSYGETLHFAWIHQDITPRICANFIAFVMREG